MASGIGDLDPLKRTLGDLLAAHRAAYGLTQQQLADAVGYARVTVAAAESGHRQPAEGFWTRCDDALDAGGDLTRAYRQIAQVRAAELRERADLADRKRSLKAGAHHRAPGLVSTAWQAGSLSGSSTASLFSQVLLFPAQYHGPEKSEDDLRRAVADAWQLRQRAEYDELGRLLLGILPGLRTLSESAGTDERKESSDRLLVHALNVTSSLLKRIGDYGLAMVAADRAVELSRSIDDPLLTAAAAHRLSNVLLSARRLDECHGISIRAADSVHPGKLQSAESYGMWGALLLTAAVAAARKGDSSGAWELMGEARTAGRLVGRDRADIFAVFGPVNTDIHGVQVAVALEDGPDAVRRSALVNADHLPTYLVERRAQYLLDLTRAHIMNSDFEAASLALCEADISAPEEVQLNPDARTAMRTLLPRVSAGRSAQLREMASRLDIL